MTGAPSRTALCLQGFDPPAQCCAVRDGWREPAALKDAALALGRVEPPAMLGRVRHLEAAGDPTRLAGRARRRQAGRGMGGS